MADTNKSGGNLSQELEQTKAGLQLIDADKNLRLSPAEMRALGEANYQKLVDTLKKAGEKDLFSPEEISHLEDILISLKEVRRLYGNQKNEIILITGSSISSLKEIITDTQTSLANLKKEIANNKVVEKKEEKGSTHQPVTPVVPESSITPEKVDPKTGIAYEKTEYAKFKLTPQQEDENNAVCESLNIKGKTFKEIDLSALAMVLGQMSDFPSFAAKLAAAKKWEDRRDLWKAAGYDFKTGFFHGSKGTVVELDAFAQEFSKTPEKLAKLSSLADFYRNGKTAKDYLVSLGLISSLNKDIGKDLQEKVKVFAYLADFRGDGVSGNDPDKVDSQINEGQIQAILEDQYRQTPQKCLENIAKIMEIGSRGQVVSFKNIDELLLALEKNPSLKIDFIRGVNLLKGGFVGFMKSGNLDTYYERKEAKYEVLGVEIENALKEKVNTAFLKAKQKAAGNAALLKAIEKMETEKENIVSGYRTSLINILGSAVKGQTGVGVSFSEEIAKNLSLDIGFMSANGQPQFGIGLHLNLGPNVTVGTMGAIPYLFITFEAISNVDELKKSGFDLNGYQKQGVSVIANVSSIGWGIGLSFKNSKVEGMQEKEAQLGRVLEKMKKITSIADLEKITLGEGLTPEQEKLVKADMAAYLKGIGFDALRDDLKKFALADYANRRVALFREIQGKLLEKQGTMHSETFFGIQFLAGFFPLPMFGAGFESVHVGYKDDNDHYLDDKFARSGVKTVDEGLKQVETWLPDGITLRKENGYVFIEGNPEILSKLVLQVDPEVKKNMKYEAGSMKLGDVKGLFGFGDYDKKKKYQKLIIGDPAKAVAISHEQLIAETAANDKFLPLNFSAWSGGAVSDAMRSRFEAQMPEEIKTLLKDSEFHEAIMVPLVNAEPFAIFAALQKNLNDGKNFEQSAAQIQSILSYSSHEGAATLSTYIGKVLQEYSADSANPEKQYALTKILVELKYIFMKDVEVLDIAGKVLPQWATSQKGISSNYELYAESDFGGGTRKNAFARMIRNEAYGFAGSAEAILGAFDTYFQDETKRVGWEIKDVDTEGKTLNNLMAAVGCFAVQYEGGEVNQVAKGMDVVPPGITSVANGKLVKFDPNASEAANIVDFFLSREWYAQKMLSSMQAATGLGEALTKERFKELLTTGRLTKEQVGKNIVLDRTFVAFLAGPCGNPSVGIRLNALTVEGKTTPLAFGVDGSVHTSTPVVNIRKTRVGIIFGKEDPNARGNYTRIDEGPGGTDVPTGPDNF